LDKYGEVITKFTVTRAPIFVESTKENGWALLLVRDSGVFKELKFNDGTYPSNPSVLPKAPYDAPSGHAQVMFDDELFKSYETAAQTITQGQPVQSAGHAEWIQKWIDTNQVNASLDHHHFFIEGSNLAELTKRLMENARKNLNVVNPFVEGHMLGTTLRDAAKRGVDITLITRQPKNDKKRWAFHKTLLSEGVDMYYSGDRKGSSGAHSKLVIVDEEVAIVSSMNFTMNSEVDTWETGIVTVEKDAVDTALESIRLLEAENETRSAKVAHKWLDSEINQ